MSCLMPNKEVQIQLSFLTYKYEVPEIDCYWTFGHLALAMTKPGNRISFYQESQSYIIYPVRELTRFSNLTGRQ